MINIIVAAGEDGAIGKNGGLIWHIPADLKHFKKLTTGYPIIMGRNTWESLPKQPLPGRRNIVVTRNTGYMAEGAEVSPTPEEALKLCGEEDSFIIGGEQIYRAMLPFADKLYLTEIKGECQDADSYFVFDKGDWEATETGEWEQTDEGVEYRFMTLIRRE